MKMIIAIIPFALLICWAICQEVARLQHKRRVEKNYRDFKKKH